MEKEVDVITLCKKLTEKTAQERCAWKETSERNRFKLSLKNGAVEIYHFIPSELDVLNREYYEVSLFDQAQVRYATYKGIETQSDSFKAFKSLFQSIRAFLERIRRRKIALLYEEINESDASLT